MVSKITSGKTLSLSYSVGIFHFRSYTLNYSFLSTTEIGNLLQKHT